MPSTEAGLFLGGAQNQINTDRQIGVQEQLAGIQSDKLELERRIAAREQLMNTVSGVTESIVGAIEAAPSRDRISSVVTAARSQIETLVGRAAEAGLLNDPGSVLTTFDNAVLGAQTAAEKGAAEGTAAVSTAEATAEGVQGLPPEIQGNVERLLGLGEPRQTQEFFGLLPMLDDPSLTPEQREFVTGRLNKLSSNNELGLVFNVDGETGNISIAQVPAGEAAGVSSRLQSTGRNLDRLRGQRDTVTQGLTIARALIDNNAPLGIRLDVRRLSENLAGGVADLLGVQESELEERFQALVAQTDFEDPGTFDVGTIDAAEGFLMFAVARALTPDQDRILATTLDRARDLTKLGGFTSDERVRERLDTIATILESADTNLARRQQQGVTGTTTIPRQPAIESPTGEAGDTLNNMEELLNQLDELLGG